MTKAELEKACVFVKKESTVKYPTGAVNMTYYRRADLQCGTSQSVKVGDRIRIEKGRKYPIGTEGVVVRVCENQYAGSFVTAFFGENVLRNPSLQVVLDNDEKIWTVGENCLNLTTLENSIDGKIYDNNKDYPENYGYESDEGFWYFGVEGQPIYTTETISDCGFRIADYNGADLLKETADEYVMVLYDWRSDTYAFLAIKKEVKSGNQIVFNRHGVSIQSTDMYDVPNGFAESFADYNNYLAEKEVA